MSGHKALFIEIERKFDFSEVIVGPCMKLSEECAATIFIKCGNKTTSGRKEGDMSFNIGSKITRVRFWINYSRSFAFGADIYCVITENIKSTRRRLPDCLTLRK